MEITKEQFEEYEKVRQSGVFNMLDPDARLLTSLSKGEWIEIITNYNKYSKLYK